MDLRRWHSAVLALPIAALAVASLWAAPAQRDAPSAEVASHEAEVATTYVFGYLERLGDANSFVRRCDWAPLVVGRGRATHVTLVVVPGDAPLRRLATVAAVLDAQAHGELYVIDTFRRVRRGESLGFACAARAAPAWG
jgi:hypothetical protein